MVDDSRSKGPEPTSGSDPRSSLPDFSDPDWQSPAGPTLSLPVSEPLTEEEDLSPEVIEPEGGPVFIEGELDQPTEGPDLESSTTVIRPKIWRIQPLTIVLMVISWGLWSAFIVFGPLFPYQRDIAFATGVVQRNLTNWSLLLLVPHVLLEIYIWFWQRAAVFRAVILDYRVMRVIVRVVTGVFWFFASLTLGLLVASLIVHDSGFFRDLSFSILLLVFGFRYFIVTRSLFSGLVRSSDDLETLADILAEPKAKPAGRPSATDKQIDPTEPQEKILV